MCSLQKFGCSQNNEQISHQHIISCFEHSVDTSSNFVDFDRYYSYYHNMKVVINKCYGGFGLSPLAYQRLCELQNKPCYFFKSKWANSSHKNEPCTVEEAGQERILFSVYTVPNPDEVYSEENFHELSDDEKTKLNELYKSISVDDFGNDRSNPLLVQVVKELGDKANGIYAELKIVNIPKNAKWHISDYDGLEHVAEEHRTWS